VLLLNVFLWMGVPNKLAPIPVLCIAVPVNFLMVRYVFKREWRAFLHVWFIKLSNHWTIDFESSILKGSILSIGPFLLLISFLSSYLKFSYLC